MKTIEIPFKTESEKINVINENKNLIVVEERYLTKGNSLIFVNKDDYEMVELEKSLQPSIEAVEDAEFELKLIAKLLKWGII